MTWVHDLQRILHDQHCVLVTLNLIAGSAPRESGSRMIVTGNDISGSIGGGNLEFEAIKRARALLADRAYGSQHSEMFGLGPELNQCCGGAVSLLFEVYAPSMPPWLQVLLTGYERREPPVLISAVHPPAPEKLAFRPGESSVTSLPVEVRAAVEEMLDQKERTGITTIETGEGSWWIETLEEGLRPLLLFGAGHVGQATARLLATLPFRLRWIDSRPDVFPPEPAANVRTIHSDDPGSEVDTAEPGSIFIVMTHSHQLDEDICFKVLKRADFAWLGLIGSETKRRRFIHRLEQRGIRKSELERLVCPVGLKRISGKLPATIALSVAAQLMMTEDSDG
jgi:xanthine dehydrogenase accessory factor